jgi:hypothetical protein
MPNVPLSPETKRRLDALFQAAERPVAENFLVAYCGDELPFSQHEDMYQLERVRFAVLKLSEGKLGSLKAMIEHANIDWRDILVAAGFGNDIHAHERWFPGQDWE